MLRNGYFFAFCAEDVLLPPAMISTHTQAESLPPIRAALHVELDSMDLHKFYTSNGQNMSMFSGMGEQK